MIICFYNKDLELQETLTSWVSLLAVNTYNSMGSFTLEIQASKENSNLAHIWKYCTIDNDDNVYWITSVNVTDNRIILSGFPATYIFSKRVSVETIKNMNAEYAMKYLVDSMSEWDNLSTAELKGFKEVFSNQISDKSLLEYFQGIGSAVDMGFRVVKRNDKLIFEAYKPGLNENVKYSTSLNNVTNLNYVSSYDNLYNVAVVAGAGEGKNRVTVTVGILPIIKGTLRRELYVDARNEQPEEGETTDEYKERLKRLGIQKLMETLNTTSIQFTVSSNEDVKLGDLVNISLDEYGITFSARVTEEEIFSQSNMVERTLTIGTS